MAKVRLVLEADNTELFDILLKLEGNTTIIGSHVASILLAGEASFMERASLAFYGINVAEIRKGKKS